MATASLDYTARVWDAQTGQPLTEPLKHGARAYSAQFGPDGQRVLTTCEDNVARLWDLTPPPVTYPTWLLSLAEAFSAETLNSQGVLETSTFHKVEAVKQIREVLSREPEDGNWVTWGRWVLANPLERTISPFSKVTAREYLERR